MSARVFEKVSVVLCKLLARLITAPIPGRMCVEGRGGEEEEEEDLFKANAVN